MEQSVKYLWFEVNFKLIKITQAKWQKPGIKWTKRVLPSQGAKAAWPSGKHVRHNPPLPGSNPPLTTTPGFVS